MVRKTVELMALLMVVYQVALMERMKADVMVDELVSKLAIMRVD
jgi:hypothetical protein